MRCDTCTGPLTGPFQRAWWAYQTPDTVPAEVRADLLATTQRPTDGSNLATVLPAKPGEASGFVFEDNLWAICTPCHQLIAENSPHGLIRRYVEASYEEGGMGPASVAAALKGVVIVAAFWTHRVGSPQRCEGE